MSEFEKLQGAVTVPPAGDVEERVSTSDPLGFIARMASEGGLSYINANGERGVAVPQTEREDQLFEQLKPYDESTRGYILDLRQSLAKAKSAAKPATLKSFPGELDEDILNLIDLV
jgi:hypothetical protein